MRDQSHHILLSREEAVSQMLAALDEKFAANTWDNVPIAEACGRVVAHDVHARADAPTCLTCRMDSVAVHYDDFAAAAPELPDVSVWERGRDWEFANTGTAMPDGFDAAVVVEHVTFSEDGECVLAIDAAPSARFAGTRPRGSQMSRGELLASAGTRVTPELAAHIAAGNVAYVPVRRRPRVAFIPTGGELQTPGSPFVCEDKNVETNSVLVRAKVEAWGGEFVGFQTVRDRPAAIKLALRQACEVADIVVLNAGSSKGSADWTSEVLDEVASRVICHQTNHGPGRHSSYAIVDETPVMGISGPSGGVSPTLDFYLRPIMRRALGLEPEVSPVLARLAAPFSHGGGPFGAAGSGRPGDAPAGELPPRERPPEGFRAIRFVSVAQGSDGVLVATPVEGGPDSLAATLANAYYLMPVGPGKRPPAPGDLIPVELRGAF